MDENITMDELNNEVSEPEQTMDEFYAEQEEAESSVPWKLLGGAAAAIGIAGGIAWKKFGPGLKAKAKEAKKARLEKQKAKLAEKQLKLDVELKKYETPETPTEETKTE